MLTIQISKIFILGFFGSFGGMLCGLIIVLFEIKELSPSNILYYVYFGLFELLIITSIYLGHTYFLGKPGFCKNSTQIQLSNLGRVMIIACLSGFVGGYLGINFSPNFVESIALIFGANLNLSTEGLEKEDFINMRYHVQIAILVSTHFFALTFIMEIKRVWLSILICSIVIGQLFLLGWKDHELYIVLGTMIGVSAAYFNPSSVKKPEN